MLLAIGGSTNAVIHLAAIAGRAGVPVSLERLNELSDTTPVLVNLKPVGNGYMEDFFAAGGMGALMREIKDLLHLDCMTVTGETLGERLAADADAWVDRTIIAERKTPLEPQGGLVALFGNLAPQGAILKRSAADANLFELEGRAVVFTSLDDLAARIDDPESRRRGQRYSGAAECRPAFGLGDAGGRLSADPEEARDQGRQGHGARVGRAHERHRLRHHRAARDAGLRPPAARSAWCATATASGSRSSSAASISWSTRRNSSAAPPRAKPPAEPPARGYARLYAQEILGADQGCDFAFLKPR